MKKKKRYSNRDMTKRVAKINERSNVAIQYRSYFAHI